MKTLAPLLAAALASIATLAPATTSRAQCDLPPPSPAAAGWYVVEGENLTFTAVNPALPDLAVMLTTDAPVIPRVLDFVVLPRYGGRIALLQYFAGDPGTSHLVTLVRNAVVDLHSGQTLATPLFSADCEGVAWLWFDDHVEVSDLDGLTLIALPGE